MPDRFDPYHQWLGIPPEEQPPNHYRLLAVPLFESDPNVIENAADQRMTHLRVFQAGKHGKLSQQLLNEVAAARVTLLNAEKKTAYDAQLREELASEAPGEGTESKAPEAGWPGIVDPDDVPASPLRARHKAKRSAPTPAALLGAAGALAVVILGVALWWALGRGEPDPGAVAKSDPPPSAGVRKVPPPTPGEPTRSDTLPASDITPPDVPKPDMPAAPPVAPPQLKPGEEEPAQPEPTTDQTTDAAPPAGVPPPDEPEPQENATEPAPEKIALPTTDEQKRLTAALDEAYQVAGATGPAAKTALAQKLLADGRGQAAHRAEQFVMFRRASELARDGGDAGVVFEAVDAMVHAGFNVSPWTVKAWLLKAMLSQADPGDAASLCAMADSCITLSGQAAADGAFDEAADLLDAARATLAQARSHWQRTQRSARLAANRARTPADKADREKGASEAEEAVARLDSAISAVAEHAKHVEQARREHEAVQLAQEQLKTDPDDPEACLVVGRWLCFDRGEWDAGLKLLAKGSDAALKALAAADLASQPSTPDARVARGDAWWDAAEKSEGRTRSALRRRAGQWYQDALPELTGLAQKQVETRLAQVAEEPAPEQEDTGRAPPLAVAPFDEKTARRHQLLWSRYLGVPLEHDVDMGSGVKLTLVLIPPGEFLMGSPEAERQVALEAAKAANDSWAIERIPTEAPQHRVKITRPFYLDKYEVTQAQWLAVMGNNPSELKAPANPVEQVSWDDVQSFLTKLNAAGTRRMPSAKMGRAALDMKYALPTEAQWEYACRAGTTTAFCFGDDVGQLGEYAWYRGNSGRRTQPAGRKRPNPWGLYDMHGNVWEWCADWFGSDYYANAPVDDPPGSTSGPARVARGGSWDSGTTHCRSAYRGGGRLDYRLNSLGFRLALVPADAGSEKEEPPRERPTVHSQPSVAPPPAAPASPWTLPPGAPPPAIAPFDAPQARKHQETWAKHLGKPPEQTNSIGMKFALIPPGEFMMGSTEEQIKQLSQEAKERQEPQSYIDRLPAEAPRHRVRITRPFYLGLYEVTQAEYQRVMGANPSAFSAEGKEAAKVAGLDTSRHPVEMVSWADAKAFCEKLSAMPEEQTAGRVYVLPTEAQWEYACRAGTSTKWSCGDDGGMLTDYAWYRTNSGGRTRGVGERKPNAFGLFDMHGNVWEWCADWHAADYYAASPMDDPKGPASGSRRVYRGGSWADYAGYCRSAFRIRHGPDNRSSHLGFRLALVPAYEQSSR